MKIVVASSTAPLRWVDELAGALARRGHAVGRVAGPPRRAPWPAGVALLLQLEDLVYRRRGAHMFAPGVRLSEQDVARDGEPDLHIDLTGEPPPGSGKLAILFDGSPEPAAAVAALLEGRMPTLAVVRDGGVLEQGWPANEHVGLVSAGLDSVLGRAVDLLCRAVERLCRDPGMVGTVAAPTALAPAAGSARAGAFFASSFASRLASALQRRLTQPDAWRIGVRTLPAKQGILQTGHLTPDGFSWLPDDGQRYFADPFVLQHDGRTWLFMEELPYRTNKGVISVCEMLPGGRYGQPRVVLEEAAHLSYPYVWADQAGIWMIPESSAARETVLYRAVEFPWRWQRERVLIAGDSLSDATPVQHDGRVWLFASSLGLPGTSSWDSLSLYHADSLFGDFVPHPLNPVLVDAAAARPAGPMVRRAGQLLRPAQDCRAGYGAGLTLARVDRLDETGFRQTVTGTLALPASWRASGLHTVQQAGSLEAIDILSAAAPPASAPGSDG